MTLTLPEAAGTIADAIAEFYGADRDQLGVALAGNGVTIIGSETMEPSNWATDWPRFLPHIRMLADFKVEVSTTLDGNMTVQVRQLKPRPITWRRERFGFEVGIVNGIELFTVGPSTTSGSDYATLETRLPGMMRNAPIPGGIENAKADAERLLAAFVERITA